MKASFEAKQRKGERKCEAERQTANVVLGMFEKGFRPLDQDPFEPWFRVALFLPGSEGAFDAFGRILIKRRGDALVDAKVVISAGQLNQPLGVLPVQDQRNGIRRWKLQAIKTKQKPFPFRLDCVD